LNNLFQFRRFPNITKQKSKSPKERLNTRADIELLKGIALKINDKPLVNSFDELAEKLNANRFYLVVVGLFKRGKSSLINALIGQELAPVAVTPLTSVITLNTAAKPVPRLRFKTAKVNL